MSLYRVDWVLTRTKYGENSQIRAGLEPSLTALARMISKDFIMNNQIIDHLRQLKGDTHMPRTRHLNVDGFPLFTNRLSHETSPYLLQHAHNPVNWFPWGEEALNKARTLNRPLFVSIGYATCHWCHVMEEESFEDLEIADYINSHFVPVKVDREERPDIDAIYMGAIQLLNGNGGWPLNVFLTSQSKPFFGGTYFPARDGDRGPSTGFLTLLKRIREAFDDHPESIEKSSEELTLAIRRMMAPPPGHGIPDNIILEKAADLFKRVYDPDHGGMKGSPKFPSTLAIRFLMRCSRKNGDSDCLDMALHTLRCMAQGGIYDQIGGGFHRYSTDAAWLVPHFEKMLYDNALLAMAYLEAYQISGDEIFSRITKEILNYILKEMRSPDGLFYSATDADSLNDSGEKEEGFFFTWMPEDLDLILDKDLAELAKSYFSIKGKPHFEGRYIPHINRDERSVADKKGLSIEAFRNKINLIKETLYHERLKREKPLTDTKIITAWNSLMISAFARAGFVLDHPGYTDAAEKASKNLLEKVLIKNRLFRTWQGDKPKHRGCLDDHAFLVQALIDLYESTLDLEWLKKAIDMDDILGTYFEDKEDGGYFMTASDHEALIAREKPGHDNATPSGNSVQALNLLKLHSLTGDFTYLKRAEKTFKAVAQSLEQSPHAFGDMLLALDYYHGLSKEIVILTCDGSRENAGPFLDVLRRSFVPNKVVAVVSSTEEMEDCMSIIPIVSGKISGNHAVLAYVCEKGQCGLPCTDPIEFGKKLMT